MTINYILTHTPAQIATEYSADEIKAEINMSTPFDIDWIADHLFSNTDPLEFADQMPDISLQRCEDLLKEWYDECDEPRPCTAKQLEIAHILYMAWYIRCNNDEEEDNTMIRVENQYGDLINFEAAVNLMDDDIRESLHAGGIEDAQEFFDKYTAAHVEKFGEDWILNTPNPQY